MALPFDYDATNRALAKTGTEYRLPEPASYGAGPNTALMSSTPSANQANLTATTTQAAPPPAPATTVTVTPAATNDPGAPAPEKNTPAMPSTEQPGTGAQLAATGAQMMSDSGDDGKAGVLGRVGAAIGGIISAYTGNYGGAMAGAKKAITG